MKKPQTRSRANVQTIMMVTLFLLALSGPALAGTYSGGDGTSAAPYQIATTADLIELSNTTGDWGAYFIQTANIAFDADETTVDWDGDGSSGPAEGFLPIGNTTTRFTGSYDGQNYTIANLYILRDGFDGSGDYIGLFGYADELKNIGLVNPVVTGAWGVGGLVGYLSSSGSIDNCYAEEGAGGEVSGYIVTGGLAGRNDGSITNAYATVKAFGISDELLHGVLGGLVGRNYGTITDCRAAGTVEGLKGISMGGLAGDNSGTITNCFSTGTVRETDQINRAGGLVGSNTGTIDRCHSTGSIQATYSIGGLVGVNGENTGKGEIINCYATGKVQGNKTVGGLVGQNGSETKTGTITGSFAAGPVTAKWEVGGLVGRNGYYQGNEPITISGTGTITNCYAIGDALVENNEAGGLVFLNVESTITNTYAAGNVTADSGRGLVAREIGNSTITQSFWDTDTTGANDSSGGAGKTTAEMKQPGTFTGWTFDADNWAISDGNSRPYLAWQKVAVDNGYPDSIAATSVTFPEGNIHNNAGEAIEITYGYMYKQNAPPTWQDSTKLELGTTTVPDTDDLTLPQTPIDTLTSNTAYYARAYADDGNDIWYGQVVRFTTPALYTLTVTNGTGGGDYTAGTEVSIVADAPQEGHSFDAWTGDTGSVDDVSSASTTLTMPAADIQVTAEFRVNQYTVTFRDHDGAELKTETVSHGGSATAPDDPTRYGYTFVEWDTAFDNVSADLTITARYALNTYTLTYTAGANGSIDGESPQAVTHGADGATVTAVPAAGYHFAQWSDGVTTNPRTDTGVVASLAVEAVFQIDAPVIESFYVDPETLAANENAVLAWSVRNAAEIHIQPDIGPVSAEIGTRTISPAESTTYTLTATNTDGEVSQSAIINVSEAGGGAPPAAPALIRPAEGATDVSIMPELAAGEFSDPENGTHTATRWQIARDTPDFRAHNLVYDEITSDHLTAITVPPLVLQTGGTYYWRVMYSDGHNWSEDSADAAFTLTTDGPVFNNGVDTRYAIDTGDTVSLDDLFTEANGQPVNTDQIKAFFSSVAPDVQIGVEISAGRILRVFNLDPADFIETDGQPDLPYGMICLLLEVPQNSDGSLDLTLHVSEQLPDGFTWWAYDPAAGEFYPLSEGSGAAVARSISPSRQTLTLTDGDTGDVIETPDDRISLMVGPALADAADNGDSVEVFGGDGSSSNGCFIGSLK